MEQIQLTRKNVLTCSFVLIALSFLFIVVFPTFGAYAAKEDKEDLPHIMIEFINQGAVSEVKKILIGEESDPSAFYAAVTEEGSMGFLITNALKGVGMGIVTLFAYIKMVTEIHKGQNPVESFIKALIETCASALVILYLDDLLKGLDQLGAGIVNLIDKTNKEGGNEVPTISLKALVGAESGGIVWLITSCLTLIIPWLASLVAIAVAKIVSYSILIELAIRRAFAPLAIGDIAGEGLRSPGIRYFKRYLAVYLKMAICLVICIVISDFTSAASLATGNGVFAGFVFIINNIAINFTAIGLMFKTGEYANDIVGA